MVEEKEQEKQKVEEQVEGKKEGKKPFWENIPPIYVIGGGFLIFFALRSMMQVEEGKNQYMILIVIVGVLLYLLSKSAKTVEEFVTPKEAELLVERELERKKKWGQFPLMARCRVGPVSNLIHRDARGMYYDVGVECHAPWELPQYYVAKVMVRGPERGFVVMPQSQFAWTGRETENERTILPYWMKMSKEYPFMDKMFGRYGGF